MLNLTLYSKPDCHLCEEARDSIDAVVAEFESRVAIDEIDITTDPQLQRQYGEEIPVVFVGERRHSQWHVDAGRLRDRIRASLDENS